MFADASGNYLYGPGPRRARQRQSVEHRQLRARPGKRGRPPAAISPSSRSTRAPGRLSLVVECAGHGRQRPADHLLPGSGQPCRLRVLRRDMSSPSPARPTPTAYPYTGGTLGLSLHLFERPGQLTLSQNSSQPLGITQGTAIVSTGGVIYVLDNEPITSRSTRPRPRRPARSFPTRVATAGALAGGAQRRRSRRPHSRQSHLCSA